MNQVATQNAKPVVTLKSVLSDDKVLAQIQRALPEHMDADRMARIAITAATRTPKLNQCTIESVMKCLLDLSSMGLEPDGRMAHLIPYKRECTLIVDYKGLVDMAYRSGQVKSIHADVVRAGDVFEFNLGKVTNHTPWAFRFDEDKPSEAGSLVAAYCVIELQAGASKHEVMTIGEVESIRSRSAAGNSGPWKSDFSEMAKKTVFRRASKWIPMSAELRNHVDRDFDSLPKIDRRQARRSALNDVVDTPAIEAIDEPEGETVATDSKPLPEIEIVDAAIAAIDAADDVSVVTDQVGIAEQGLDGLKLPAARKKELLKTINEAAKEKHASLTN